MKLRQENNTWIHDGSLSKGDFNLVWPVFSALQLFQKHASDFGPSVHLYALEHWTSLGVRKWSGAGCWGLGCPGS